ncbi:DUF7210 family protein [Undibacterium sp. Di27W]|uniref:DUF7210 family protein n=1 Tax=Undibacterium sp. Di27W TaxID=3413036 RepID=UPI003BF0DA13
MSNQNVAVRLKKPHTHAGVKYETGAEISVSPMDAEWLTAVGVGELVNPEKEPDGKSGKDAKK